jgi:hypothetical protein
LPNFDRLTLAVWTPSRLVTSRRWIRGMGVPPVELSPPPQIDIGPNNSQY